MRNLCAECAENISGDDRHKLNDKMMEVFEDLCDEEHRIELVAMAFMLSNGLSYILMQMIDDIDCEGDCERCKEKKRNEFSKLVH